ncbi:unnamed protein product [Staurois parvus]|uniref:Uncharacterized protein n=1 Tax=Staurois parvus TaxID=386267 RepID=A0ABN9G8U4_9NEOB|nr:unnamed protein product [Staurois parvus]
MGLSATLWFLMGLTAGSMAAPLLRWSDDDAAVMALYSADYYNKVSREDVLYGLLENDTEYITDEKSRFHQLSFSIQETGCQKSDKTPTDGCAFKEGGVVKSCTSDFFEDDDRDMVVVTCQNQDGHREHSRVRRSHEAVEEVVAAEGEGVVAADAVEEEVEDLDLALPSRESGAAGGGGRHA